MADKSEDQAAVATPVEKAIAKPIEALSIIRVRVVDARAPFPNLAFLNLQAVPQRDDLISLEMSNGVFASYKVEFCNFAPQQEFQVTIGCLPPTAAVAPPTMTDAQIKEKQDELSKSNNEAIEKGLAYTKTIIAAGYASGFALWAFTKDAISIRSNELFALLFGVSLLLFISWEIYGMYVAARDRNLFNQLVDATPIDFFKRWDEFQKKTRAKNRRFMRLWLFIFWPTVALGYAGILFLMYNIFAKLAGWPVWPPN